MSTSTVTASSSQSLEEDDNDNVDDTLPDDPEDEDMEIDNDDSDLQYPWKRIFDRPARASWRNSFSSTGRRRRRRGVVLNIEEYDFDQDLDQPQQQEDDQEQDQPQPKPQPLIDIVQKKILQGGKLTDKQLIRTHRTKVQPIQLGFSKQRERDRQRLLGFTTSSTRWRNKTTTNPPSSSSPSSMGNTESKFHKAISGWRNRHSPTARAQSEIPEVDDRRADGPAESEHINEIGS